MTNPIEADAERAREIAKQYIAWDAGWGQNRQEGLARNITFALSAARAEGIAQGRAEMQALLSCGHFVANIGDADACEACMDMAAIRAQMREIDALVIEAARQAVTAMEARAGYSLAHEQLRSALVARDRALTESESG